VRYLILSDMHGNWDAFEAVLRHLEEETFDLRLVLGDLVGYGASPNQVVEAVRGLPDSLVVRGNHDKVVAGIDDGENFNHVALAAARWTSQQLAGDNLDYVRELPQGPREVSQDVAICHGSPLDEDAYVFSDYDAFEIFSSDTTPLTFFGHTHVPSLFAFGGTYGIEVRALRDQGSMVLQPGVRYLLNPGSIGQPRDRDPRASYMIYDSEATTVSWFRLEYPVAQAQERIREAGLPDVLADRLAVGV